VNTKHLSVLLSLVLPIVPAQAQWRSVHATKTKTETITRADGSTQTTVTTSEYFRSTSGAELTVTSMKTPDGLIVKKAATLYDSEAPAQYSLDYATKTAYLVVRLPAAKPFRGNRAGRHPELEHGTYQGIDSILLPVSIEGKRVGTIWIDDKDDLELKRDITFPASHEVTELSHISMDYPCDRTLFQIPAGFAVDTSGSKVLPLSK
jgi:hypothetical protein